MIKNIFYRFFKNISECYKWKNILWQLLSFLLTYICVSSGFDWLYFQNTRNEIIQTFMWPAAMLGFLVPVFLPLCIYLWGIADKSMRLVNAAYALIQSALLGLGISSFYKVFTGRMGPHGFQGISNTFTDISHGFRLGILEGGAFQGWPSSHTTVAFATMFALFTLYPEKKWLKYVAIIYALYIGLGVSVNIYWFSDFLAGAILGCVIGIAVGKGFLKKISKKTH